MKNTIESLQKKFYWCTLYDMIDCRIAEIAKDNGWLKVDDKRYNIAMEQIAEEWQIDVEMLKEYFED